MKIALLTLIFAVASFTLGACKHRKATPIATPSATYTTGYGAVK